MAYTFTATIGSSDDADNIITWLLDNTLALRSNFADASAPGTIVEGMPWYKSGADDTVDQKLQYRDAGGWHEVGSKWHEDVNAQNYQLKSVRLENSAAFAAASTTVGRVGLDTGLSKMQFNVSATKHEVVVSMGIGDYIATPLAQMKKGASTGAPDDATFGTLGEQGWLFDDNVVYFTFRVRIPLGFDGTHDCKLRLVTSLVSTETSGDDEDWQATYQSLKPDNNEVTTASTKNVTVAKDLGTSVSANAVNTIDLTLPYNDGTVPLQAGDFLIGKVKRNGLAQVGSVILLDAYLLTPGGDRLTEI